MECQNPRINPELIFRNGFRLYNPDEGYFGEKNRAGEESHRVGKVILKTKRNGPLCCLLGPYSKQDNYSSYFHFFSSNTVKYKVTSVAVNRRSLPNNIYPAVVEVFWHFFTLWKQK